jgi:hypothetical protein
MGEDRASTGQRAGDRDGELIEMGKLPFHLLSFILEFKAVELPDISVPL